MLAHIPVTTPRNDAADSAKPLARIAYVVSARHGIHSFIYREIEELERRRAPLLILAISRGPGPYIAKQHWTVLRPRPGAVLRGLRSGLRRNPLAFVRLLLAAFRTRSMIDLVLAMSFVDAVETQGCRSVHSHFGDHKLFVGYYLSRLLRLPLTVTIHAYELYSNPNPRMFAACLDACDAVITVSEYNRRVLETTYRVDPSRLRVIRLFPWDLPPYSPPRSDAFTILSVARFVPKKGHEVLLRAVQRLVVQGHRDIRLVLVGSGPVDVPAMVNRLGLSPYVEVLQDVDESRLRSLYQGCDVFCLASQIAEGGDREGVPVSLMEAMSYGRPVVTTAHAGIPELVRVTLVPEGDPAALTEALLRLKKDRVLAEVQGLENRRIIGERFSPRNVDELITVFRRIQNAAS